MAFPSESVTNMLLIIKIQKMKKGQIKSSKSSKKFEEAGFQIADLEVIIRETREYTGRRQVIEDKCSEGEVSRRESEYLAHDRR